jgi:hypothetical protein
MRRCDEPGHAAVKAAVLLGALTVAAGASMALAGREKQPAVPAVPAPRYCTRGMCANAQRWALQALRNDRRRRWAEQREWLLTLQVEKLHRRLTLRRLQARQPSPIPPDNSWRANTVWDRLADCESGGDWSYNGSSGFDGGVQFHPGTWSAYRHDEPAYAYQATREQQIAVAERVLAAQGWSAWPACARELGLR